MQCLLYIYNILNILLFPIYLLILGIRTIKQKENLLSFQQRLGFNFTPRSEGKVIWLHAASVGESMIAISLIKSLSGIYPNLNFLITTTTISSSKIIKKWNKGRIYNQFVPLDNIFIVQKFLNYWKPHLTIFIESELWPCLISQASRRSNLLLINGRLSDNTFKIWKKQKKLFQFIVSHFSRILVQSKKDLEKYRELGCIYAKDLGNLKFANQALKVNVKLLNELRQILVHKPVFVASSTHKEDEAVILQIIRTLKEKNTSYYPIIILRHPERNTEIASSCHKLGLTFSLRSQDNLPNSNEDLFIVDTFGELGTFYSLSFIAFIGGSFKRGGHNLMEPAYFRNIIILGPDMSNFQNISDTMIKHDAALQIHDSKELQEKIIFFLDKNNKRIGQKLCDNALKFVKNKEVNLKNYLLEIEYFIQ